MVMKTDTSGIGVHRSTLIDFGQALSATDAYAAEESLVLFIQRFVALVGVCIEDYSDGEQMGFRRLPKLEHSAEELWTQGIEAAEVLWLEAKKRLDGEQAP